MSSSPAEECRSPVGLDCCSCCLDLANRSGLEEGAGGENNNPGSPTVSSFRQLREQLVRQNLNTDKLSSIMRQDSLEPVVRDPCYLFNQGICNRNIDQTLLSILLLFHRTTLVAEKKLWALQTPGSGWDPFLATPAYNSLGMAALTRLAEGGRCHGADQDISMSLSETITMICL
ncbi:hypothetical protein TURU_093782 [Turdus rufiventris]|nr:hypothetical protein TURU_093782 [Turdus rufiventris]